ncbi:MAG TPA: sulfur carrier protein ThiS [Longimicrobiales bacterium]|nr:sulfur carrier protein ThiS [Longimicrobiales bacterium]
MPMNVTVNGDPRSFASGLNVRELLEALGLRPQQVVVEHNREILDRARYESTPVVEGDSLELVHFVGGG